MTRRWGRHARHALVACVLVAGASVLPARGALPPGYGGSLRIPGTAPLRLPNPVDVSTPLEALIARATYDTLFEVRGGAVVPSLAVGPVEVEGDAVTIRLRRGIRRHDRRPLLARDVARSLRRLAGSRARPWLAGFRRHGSRLDVEVVDERTLRLSLISPRTPAVVARWLAAAPLAIQVGRAGTGPFRARMRGDALHLHQFRSAARGAPYLRAFRVEPPRDRDAELRAFELGELDASWRGASLYGQSGRDVRRLVLPSTTPVLLIPHSTQRSRLRSIALVVDRPRLARVGMLPTDTLAPGLPAPRLAGSAPLSNMRLLVLEGDQLQEELAAALAARFDEVGKQLTIVRASRERHASRVAGTGWDIRIAQVPPPLPGARGIVVAAYMELRDLERAEQLVRETHEGAVSTAAEALPAVVLGWRRRSFFHPPHLSGVRHDDLGRLTIGGIFDLEERRSRGETGRGDRARSGEATVSVNMRPTRSTE